MNIVNSQQQIMERVLFRNGFDLNERTLRLVVKNLMIDGLSYLGPVPDSEYSQMAKNFYLIAYIASSLHLYKQKMQDLIDDLESCVSLNTNYLEIMADRYGHKEDDELVALSMVFMLFMDYSDSNLHHPEVSRVFHVMNTIKDKKKELMNSSTDSTSKPEPEPEPETDPEAYPEDEVQPQPESEPKRRSWRRDSPTGLKLSQVGELVLDIIDYVNANEEDRCIIRAFHTQSVV